MYISDYDLSKKNAETRGLALCVAWEGRIDREGHCWEALRMNGKGGEGD